MESDIVDRLRYKLPLYATYSGMTLDLKQAIEEIERLRAERDEARRKICKIESESICDPPRSPQKYASLMGWDCFKDNPTGNA